MGWPHVGKPSPVTSFSVFTRPPTLSPSVPLLPIHASNTSSSKPSLTLLHLISSFSHQQIILWASSSQVYRQPGLWCGSLGQAPSTPRATKVFGNASKTINGLVCSFAFCQGDFVEGPLSPGFDLREAASGCSSLSTFFLSVSWDTIDYCVLDASISALEGPTGFWTGN